MNNEDKLSIWVIVAIAISVVALIISAAVYFERDEIIDENVTILVEPTVVVEGEFSDDRQRCIEANGEWKGFPNTDADFCQTNQNITTLSKLTYSCDCGPQNCWDWNLQTCIAA